MLCPLSHTTVRLTQRTALLCVADQSSCLSQRKTKLTLQIEGPEARTIQYPSYKKQQQQQPAVIRSREARASVAKGTAETLKILLRLTTLPHPPHGWAGGGQLLRPPAYTDEASQHRMYAQKNDQQTPTGRSKHAADRKYGSGQDKITQERLLPPKTHAHTLTHTGTQDHLGREAEPLKQTAVPEDNKTRGNEKTRAPRPPVPRSTRN